MGIKVTPLIGPSAILLALMASGLEGQRFQFVGYPPREDPARENFLRDCLRSSKAERQTVLMIETPYRGEKLFQAILRVGSAETEILIAEGVTMPSESIRTMRVEEWRRTERPPAFAEPAVFGLYQPKPITRRGS
jgi:16S rRNA (cytidine1402-2'-O)-methyltransferase